MDCKNCKHKESAKHEVFYENPMECFNAPKVLVCYSEGYDKENDSSFCENFEKVSG